MYLVGNNRTAKKKTDIKIKTVRKRLNFGVFA